MSTLSGCGRDGRRRRRRNGATPLHVAAVANACAAVTSATPLHYAAAGHSGPAAAGLAARGAEVSAATTKGVTPLHGRAAAGAAFPDAAACRLRHPAPPSAPRSSNTTPG